MLTSLSRIRGTLLTLALAATGLQAQQTTVASPSTTPSQALQLTLTPSGGASADLRQAEVSLLDNGVPVQASALQRLQREGKPTHVILVIDDVNARLTTIAYERDQLKRFLTKDDGRLKVNLSIAVMTDTKTDIQQGFSQNGVAENEVLQKYQVGLHELRRDSQYGGFDRTDIGIHTLQQLVQYAGTIPGHKVILFVSPGWPLLSGPAIQLTAKQQSGLFETVARLQDAMLRADVTLDMVNPFGPAESVLRSDYYEAFLKGVKKPSSVELADLSLQVLATHSGGTVLQGSSDIGNMVARTLAEIDGQYTFSYQPPAAGDAMTYHALQVKVSRPGVTVRAPDEYYDLGAPAAR